MQRSRKRVSRRRSRKVRKTSRRVRRTRRFGDEDGYNAYKIRKAAYDMKNSRKNYLEDKAYNYRMATEPDLYERIQRSVQPWFIDDGVPYVLGGKAVPIDEGVEWYTPSRRPTNIGVSDDFIDYEDESDYL